MAISARWPALALLCGLGAFTATFARWSATGAIDFPMFCLAVAVLVYLPGRCLVEVVRADVTPLENLGLCLTLGTIVSSAIYRSALSLAVPHLFWLWPTAAAGFLVWRLGGRWGGRSGGLPVVRGEHLLLIGLLAVAWTLLAVDPLYYPNMALRPGGGMTVVTGCADVSLHLSLANELTHTVPPQVPFLCGIPLAYHCGSDLFAALLVRVAGLDTLDVTVRFAPTFFQGMTILAVFVFCRAWLRSGSTAVLTTALVVFGEDFSFVPGLLLGGEYWAGRYFLVPSTHSLYFMNPMLPALGLLCAGLFCLKKAQDASGLAWPTIAAVHLAALPAYKVFTAVHVLAALMVTVTVYGIVFRECRLVRVLAMTAVFLAPVAWLMGQASRAGGHAQAAAFHPGWLLLKSLTATGLADTTWGRAGAALLAGGGATWTGIAVIGLVVLPGYLVGSLGLRCIGIPRLARDLLRCGPADPLRFLVAVFVTLGPVVSLTCAVGNRGVPFDSQYNNAVWFLVQSKYLAWIPAVEALSGSLRAKSPVVRAAVLVVIAGTTLPSTVQFFRFLSRMPVSTMPADELQVAAYLDAHAQPGSVVVVDRTLTVPLSASTRCRTVCDEVFSRGFATPAEVDRRRRECREFWDDWAAGILATDFLDRYGVRYLVVSGSGRAAQAVPCRERGSGRRVSLQPVFSTPTLLIYERPDSMAAAVGTVGDTAPAHGSRGDSVNSGRSAECRPACSCACGPGECARVDSNHRPWD